MLNTDIRTRFLAAVLLSLVLTWIGCAAAPPATDADTPANAALPAPDPEAWGVLLGKWVNEEGLVDYDGLKNSQEDLGRLNAYLSYLGSVNPDEIEGREEKLAFWINAYNAVTIAGVLQYYPIESVKDVEEFWHSVKARVGEKEHSLAQIETWILRPLDEPRIHWAIVRASKGGPPLLEEPYDAGKLDEQLDAQETRYLEDRRQVYIDRDKKALMLSSLFYWYGADFIKAEGSKQNYVRKYLSEEELDFLADNAVAIGYVKYDWSLNKQAK